MDHNCIPIIPTQGGVGIVPLTLPTRSFLFFLTDHEVAPKKTHVFSQTCVVADLFLQDPLGLLWRCSYPQLSIGVGRPSSTSKLTDRDTWAILEGPSFLSTGSICEISRVYIKNKINPGRQFPQGLISRMENFPLSPGFFQSWHRWKIMVWISWGLWVINGYHVYYPWQLQGFQDYQHSPRGVQLPGQGILQKTWEKKKEEALRRYRSPIVLVFDSTPEKRQQIVSFPPLRPPRWNSEKEVASISDQFSVALVVLHHPIENYIT